MSAACRSTGFNDGHAEACVGGTGELFDGSGAIKKPETKRFLDKIMAAFAPWLEKTAKAPA